MPARSEKAATRTRLVRIRNRMTAEDHARRSDRIVDRLQALPEIQTAAVVHVFWPMHGRGEVDVRPFIAWLYTHKKQIVLPVVATGTNASQVAPGEPAERLEHRRFHGADALVRSTWGIDEPADAEQVPVERIDAVVVPALGVDRSGNRLGYGRGFYDRFLGGLSIPTICPIFQECFEVSIPVEEHDVPVRIVITENEVWRVPSS